MKEKREKFSNRIGFILSCVGAAIGLGNIWLFSWKLGTFGGGAFLIPYFIFVILFSFVGLISEISFGRMMKKGVLGVGELMKKKKIPFSSVISWVPVLSVSGIFTFYVIVFGWVIKYFVMYLITDMNNINYGEYFNNFAGSSSSIVWHITAAILSIVVISFGVVKGIEKLNKIIMPLMFMIFIGLVFKSLSLPGAAEGVKYLLIPRWELLAKPITWIMALGQAFFTVGLSGSALLVYGSYLDKDIDIPASVFHTCILDTCAALLAGFIIIPAAFAFGFKPDAGPSLLFITIPAVFSQMTGGKILGTVFFLSIIFAAVSSAVNQLIGIPLDINMNLFGKFADIMSVYMIPLGAVFVLGFYFFFVGKEKVINEINEGSKYKIGAFILNVGKYIFTPGVIIILILGFCYGSIG